MSSSRETAEIRLLIDRLVDPSARRAARQELVRLRAVEGLIECLASPNESVVWAAVQSLGELRAPEALPRLVELLERDVLTTYTLEALQEISGQEFAADSRKWREWLGRGPATAAVASEKPADLAELVRGAGELLGAAPQGLGRSFTFRLSQPDGRGQLVRIHSTRTGEEELVVVYSECGPAQPKHFEVVLRKNAQLPVGAFGIRDVDGAPAFVLVETLPAERLSAQRLARTIERIAARADTVEKSLTPEDER